MHPNFLPTLRSPRLVRLRASLATALALGTLVLTGCGDPDDGDDGGGGGGYVAQEQIAS